MYVYIENIKNPNIRFKVNKYDKETKLGTLEGEYGAVFSRDLSKASLEKYGYKLVKSDVELPLLSSDKAKAAAAAAAAAEAKASKAAKATSKKTKVVEPEDEEE